MIYQASLWGALKDQMENGIYNLVGSGAPASSVGTGFAAIGSTYRDTATGNEYQNTGTTAVPVWTLLNIVPTTGTAITSSATIAPTNAIHHVTGTVPIVNITVPTGFQGPITLIPDGTFTTTTAGNISLASTAVVNKALIMTYDGTKWNPSY